MKGRREKNAECMAAIWEENEDLQACNKVIFFLFDNAKHLEILVMLVLFQKVKPMRGSSEKRVLNTKHFHSNYSQRVRPTLLMLLDSTMLLHLGIVC